MSFSFFFLCCVRTNQLSRALFASDRPPHPLHPNQHHSSTIYQSRRLPGGSTMATWQHELATRQASVITLTILCVERPSACVATHRHRAVRAAAAALWHAREKATTRRRTSEKTYPIQGQLIGTQSVEWSTDFSTGRNKIITGSAEQCGVHGVYVRTFKAIEDDLAFRPLVPTQHDAGVFQS